MSKILKDGRVNFKADDNIEQQLENHFKKYSISHNEIWKNFPIYVRRSVLKKFLAHYELFRKVINLPGDIVELGIYRGASLFSWANFSEIRNMGDRQKRIFGFDNFSGFSKIDKKDGKQNKDFNKISGGFDSKNFEEPLMDAISIFDNDRFIPYKDRIKIIKGNVENTIPTFVKNNPGIRISLLHFDVDLYKPTLIALKKLWPLVVPGGIVVFDEYGIPPWEGESKAVDEFFKNQKIILNRFEWSSNPGAYLIKS
jgi:hypothetical protein